MTTILHLKKIMNCRTWETFTYTIVTAILEDLVNAILGPKAAPSKEVIWNERVEIATHGLVEVVAWEQKQERSLASRRLYTESKLLLRQ